MLAVALSLPLASAATAATRYAAPGGTGADPCANPAKPCSVSTAADKYAPRSTVKAGDVVELAPGTYHAEGEGESKSEFGLVGTVTPPKGVTIRGEPGKARPVIVVRGLNETSEGAFSVGPAVEVANVEIRNRVTQGSAIGVWGGGTLDRVIARSAVRDEPTCYLSDGTMRNSACFNSGGGSALGGGGTFPSVIRNSTLIATGPGSVGMEFTYEPFKGRKATTINGIGVLARGEAKDVIARGEGGTIEIELQASDYATVETEASQNGRASITPPGTNGNITALPLLAAGNLHQLPGSPTIDKGAVDGASDTLDIDSQSRTIGGLPDIGADELGDPAPQVNPTPATRLGNTHGS